MSRSSRLSRLPVLACQILAPLVCVALVSITASAAEGFKRQLFNGKDLSGWHVTRCEAGVEDGALVLQNGNGFVRSDHRYKDFVLELDWKSRQAEKWDSGIYFRSELPGPTGRAWPTLYQVNLAQGMEGNVKDLNASSTGLIKPGEWNHFKLTVVGATAALEINGQHAWKVDGVKAADGYIGLQAETPIGGQFEFRNITITELGFQSLFNGKDLGSGDTGWEGGGADASACWKVEDGLLLCTGQKGTWLRSGKQYGDFNLRLEYKLKEGGNSGVFVRVPHDGKHRGRELGDGQPSGVEIQLLDDAAKRYASIEPAQFSASIYAVAPANPHVSRPAGEWNSIEIDCRGDRYRVSHNGVQVIDANNEKSPGLKDRELKGYLGLQNHNEAVWFRNLRVAESQYAK